MGAPYRGVRPLDARPNYLGKYAVRALLTCRSRRQTFARERIPAATGRGARTRRRIHTHRRRPGVVLVMRYSDQVARKETSASGAECGPLSTAPLLMIIGFSTLRTPGASTPPPMRSPYGDAIQLPRT